MIPFRFHNIADHGIHVGNEVIPAGGFRDFTEHVNDDVAHELDHFCAQGMGVAAEIPAEPVSVVSSEDHSDLIDEDPPESVAPKADHEQRDLSHEPA